MLWEIPFLGPFFFSKFSVLAQNLKKWNFPQLLEWNECFKWLVVISSVHFKTVCLSTNFFTEKHKYPLLFPQADSHLVSSVVERSPKEPGVPGSMLGHVTRKGMLKFSCTIIQPPYTIVKKFYLPNRSINALKRFPGSAISDNIWGGSWRFLRIWAKCTTSEVAHGHFPSNRVEIW